MNEWTDTHFLHKCVQFMHFMYKMREYHYYKCAIHIAELLHFYQQMLPFYHVYSNVR